LVIGSEASTARSESSVDIQIDLWNRYLTNNVVWVFSHEIKELSCKLLFMLFVDFASISCFSRFLYIRMSSVNPSFHDAIEEIAHV
jgi:hypothetical protein